MPPYTLSRFSQRFAWSTPQNPYSQLLQQKRAAGLRLLDLTTANPTEVFRDYPHQDIARPYGAVADFHYEPEAFGTSAARQIVASWYVGQGIPATPSRIALTASTSEAYSVLFKLLCNPGDEILIPCPSYPLFEYLARAEAVNTVPYQLPHDGGWFIDFDSLQRAISRRTKAIVIVNPNNPTGSFLKVAEKKKLASLAEKHDIALISDEVFMTYPAAASPGPGQIRTLIGHDEILSFSLNGLSKAAGMPQMKLGWIAVNGPRKEIAATLPKLELLLDSYLSVATPVQCALGELLKIGSGLHRKIAGRLQRNREALVVFEGSSVEPLRAEGGWSVILQVPNVRTEEEWLKELLASGGVVVQPGYFYDMPKEAFLVVSLLADPGEFAEGIDKLKHLALRC